MECKPCVSKLNVVVNLRNLDGSSTLWNYPMFCEIFVSY
ncbi:hypothetical protein MFUM_1050023 [Methylacidiphilum fumariolicum SolV]|uniref:Uncharacterized protein n=2 Tax=Candidatus Methylacidiphilum fumarolicum TaxID=591154 RepID=I0JW58_METFB|nr:conserved protein of unknown function [Candidatus Methylacidiphilum fumarolicum]CCG91477.1 hypothetical protein MFUM_1050023 [Methylacidiphilum fumariolicum SolV]